MVCSKIGSSNGNMWLDGGSLSGSEVKGEISDPDGGLIRQRNDRLGSYGYIDMIYARIKNRRRESWLGYAHKP